MNWLYTYQVFLSILFWLIEAQVRPMVPEIGSWMPAFLIACWAVVLVADWISLPSKSIREAYAKRMEVTYSSRPGHRCKSYYWYHLGRERRRKRTRRQQRRGRVWRTWLKLLGGLGLEVVDEETTRKTKLGSFRTDEFTMTHLISFLFLDVDPSELETRGAAQ